MSIRKLAEHVIQQIAAGEVLERPANLVKELVENALDAEASFVRVNVEKDVLNLEIIDNGKGIEKEDLALSLERHATSKIEDAGDLWALDTYGFRGEALACVSAVSNFTIESKARDAAKAFKISADFGVTAKVEASNLEEGTHIRVSNLFSNVPARLKFLKSESAELMQIKKTFKTFAFTYPQVHFQLFYDGQLVFDLAPQSKRKYRAENLLDIATMYESHYQQDGIEVFAVFSSPSDIQKTSKNLWVFVQDRWVQDRSLNAAILSAYESTLMHGQFPNAIVWVKCNPQEVDVNVHPTKSQVKFREPSRIFRAVRTCIREEVMKAPWRKGSAPAEMPVHQSALQEPVEETAQFPKFDFTATHFATKTWEPNSTESSQQKQDLNESTLTDVLDKYKEKQVAPSIQRKNWEVQPFWSNLQVLGQCNLTYIIAQSDKSLFLVDQHAAHERIGYEKLMHAWRNQEVEIQSYLFPYEIEMAEDSLKKIMTVQEDLHKLGFQIESHDNKLSILAGPSLVKDHMIGKTFEAMAESLLESEDTSLMEQKISNICATIACHSVLRAGQALSNPEMKALLEQMDEFPLSTYCPHGRPVYIEYPFHSLEKSFGRIVT